MHAPLNEDNWYLTRLFWCFPSIYISWRSSFLFKFVWEIVLGSSWLDTTNFEKRFPNFQLFPLRLSYIEVILHWGCLPLGSSSIEVVLHFLKTFENCSRLFQSINIKKWIASLVNFQIFVLRSYSIEVFFHWGRLPHEKK